MLNLGILAILPSKVVTLLQVIIPVRGRHSPHGRHSGEARISVVGFYLSSLLKHKAHKPFAIALACPLPLLSLLGVPKASALALRAPSEFLGALAPGVRAL